MMFYIAVTVFFGCILIVIAESLSAERRRQKIDSLIGIQTKSGTTKIKHFMVRFGKEHRKELEQKLIEAGYYNKEWAKYYFPLKFLILAVLIALVVFSDLSSSNKMLGALLSLVGVIVVPDLVLSLRSRMLIGRTSAKLPYLLDMMSVCVQTGMTIEASLAYLADELEMFDKDLCYQIRRTSDAARIHGLEKALNDLGQRLPTPAVRSFVLTVIQNLQYGTSVAQVMSDLAEDIRKVQILTVEEKVGKLAAKMSVPLILFIMFPIVVLILAPGIMQMSISLGS